MSPSDCVLQEPLNSVGSSPEPMLERTLSASPSLASTLISTGPLRVDLPATVIVELNVTGESNVVTRVPISSSSSSESTSSADSRNVSSPVIALTFLLPM